MGPKLNRTERSGIGFCRHQRQQHRTRIREISQESRHQQRAVEHIVKTGRDVLVLPLRLEISNGRFTSSALSSPKAATPKPRPRTNSVNRRSGLFPLRSPPQSLDGISTAHAPKVLVSVSQANCSGCARLSSSSTQDHDERQTPARPQPRTAASPPGRPTARDRALDHGRRCTTLAAARACRRRQVGQQTPGVVLDSCAPQAKERLGGGGVLRAWPNDWQRRPAFLL